MPEVAEVEVIGKHLAVREQPQKRGRKTRRWHVQSRSEGKLLGIVEWHSPWRQYNFDPNYGTTFSAGCLSDIAAFLKEKTTEQRGSG
ncbi:MAG: hypothetical protein FVQ81_02185 [Candidatus Glassbacteria bacterium]|nr:hypothetical protein [Candidatus Glassbacteria bacterium]